MFLFVVGPEYSKIIITWYLFCYGEKTPFKEVVMLKIDCNFSWHGNQVITAWSIATVLYMYVCDQLH